MFVCMVDDMRAVTPDVDLGGAASLLCRLSSDQKARRKSQNVYSCGVPDVGHRHEEKGSRFGGGRAQSCWAGSG